MLQSIHGVLLLDKPLGFSSNQALQKVKKLLQARKAGHTGSLDPLATGLLPICFGEASKFASFGLNANKSYEAVMKLGISTTTADAEGEIIARYDLPVIEEQALHRVSKNFLGDHLQTPPMYSALKQNGVPLYQLARQGKEVERKSRPVSIHDLQLKSLDHQHVHFKVTCSKGTYVRTLAEDIAKALGCGGAHLTSLRRTQLGHLATPMISLQDLETHKEQDYSFADLLLPLDIFLKELPALQLGQEEAKAILQGKKVFMPPAQLTAAGSADTQLRFYSEENVFLGIGTVDSLGYLQPKRLVSQEYLNYVQHHSI